MIDATKYYFSPSAMTVTPNMVTGSFTRSETIEVSVMAGAAIKVANKLVTQANRELNLGYNAQLDYRQFTFLGYNTVLGHPNNQYIGVPVYVYIRLDASNNGSTGELVFLPYEVDYDGRLLLAEGSSPVIYESIPIETHTDQQGNTYYTLANTNSDSDSRLYYYYIHIATLSAPVNGQRGWIQNLQIGQLETSKGNDEKEDPVLEKMFRLVNNVINVLLPFDKLSFSKSAPAFVERILTTTSESIDDFATWAQQHALATTASIASYVSARLKILDDRFFRKDQPDTDPHLATFGNLHIASGLDKGDGTTSEGNLEVDENANIGGTLDVDGKFTANDVAEIKKMLTLLEGVKSNDYVDDDPVGKGGWMITNKDEHGNSYMVIDKLFVRLKAIFNELEIRKLSYAGGNIILSRAGSKVIRVSKIYEGGIEYQDYIIELDDATWHDRGIYISDLAGAEYDEDNRCVILPNAHLVPNPVPPPPESSVIAYRCYLLKDDGTTATENWWRVDDQAKCQTFNIVEPGTYQNAENTYYWRLVTGIGTKVLEDGMTYDYIDLSKDDHDDATTDIPKEGDELVQMGNRTDTERQGFIALEVTGEYAPALMLYNGVNGYSLNGKRKIIISPKLTEFIVNKWVQETDYGVFPQTKERGDWSDITPDEQGNRKCYYYDLVQHNGASWLCITGNEYTTDEPSENSAAWRVYAQKGVKGDKGDSITKSSADTYRYATNNTGVRPDPSSSDWQTTKPAIQKGYWLYVETTIHWSDGTTTVIYNDERNPNDGVPGQDIVVDGATVMRYCCNQSNTTHPAEDSTEWKTLDQVTQRQGWWLWSQATTFYRKSSSSEGSHDAGKSVSYNVNYIAEDGDTPEAARGISSITEYYKATNSNTPLPTPSSDTGWDTDPNLSHLQDKWDADHIYLWNYEKVTYSKAPLVERTIPQILAIWTKDGEAGRGIDSITNKYKVTTTSVAPAREHEGGTGWSNTPVAPAKGEYLWNYEIISWTKGTTPTYTDVQQIGYAGTDGSSITKSSETPYYIKNTTGVRPAENDPNWNTTKPTVGKGEWLFTKTVITWSDNSTTILYTDERNPNDGASGQDIVVDGDTVIKYAVSNTNTTAPTQWYNYSEIVSQIVPGKWLWSKATTYYRKSGSASGSHDAGSSSNTNVSYIGINGTSVSVDANNSKTQYAVSTSPTVTPSSWQDTMPNVPQGQYLWTKVTTAFTDGNSTVSYGVSYRGIDGDDVQIDTSRTYVRYSTVKTASQPADSTFTRTTPPDLSEGDYLWSLSQTAYVGVTNVLKSYSVSRLGIDGEEGQRGPDGYTTHFAYATSADGSQNFSTTNFAGATYIGTYKDDKSEDSLIYTDYVWTAWKGTNGENGRALTASSEHYNVSNSSSTQWDVPSSGTWAGEWTTDPNVPNQQGQTQWGENNRYLWNYEKVTYTESDGTTTIARTTPKVIAIWTKDGAEGRGIDSITNMYAIGDNPLTPPVSGWDDEPMAPTSENPFLWNYEIISWTKGTPATTETTKHVIGRFGSDSASLYIENPNIYIPVDKDGKVSTADGQPFVARVPFYAIAGSRALAHYSAELDEDGTVDYCTFGGQGAYDPTDNIFKRTGDEVSIEGAYVDGRGIVLPNSIVFAPSDVIITIPNNSVLDEHSAYVTLTALDSQGGQYTVFGAIEMRGRVLAKTPDEPMQAFQWNGSATVAPSPLPSGANLGSWSASAPNRPAGEKFLWMTQTVRHTAYNGDVTYDNWSQATRISGDKGTPGEDASDTEWIYTRNDTGVTPDTPTSPTQAGWTDHPQGVTSSLKYEYASFRRKPAGNNQQWGAFQPPILWSHYGRNGIDGDGVEYVYARTKDATAPAVPQSGTYSEENNNYDVDEHLPYVRVLSSKDISGSTTPVTSGAYKYAKCTDDPVGVDDTWKYEWVLKRSKTSPDASGNRKWEPYSGDSVNHKMSEWANYAEKGDKGDDAVNVIVTPASLIVNQDMETLTNLSNLTETFVVQVKIGETSQTVNNIFFKSEQKESNYYKLQFLKNGGTSGGEGTINGSTLTLKAINTYEKDGEDYYYDHAYADLVITYNTNKTINARINVYANLLGGWAHKLQGDLQEDIATMKFYFKDENGNVVAYETIGDYIKSSTENVTTLQEKTNGTITAMSELAQTANSVSMKVYEGVLPKDLFSHSDSVQDYSITNNYESLPVITNTTQFKTFTASLPMTHRVKNRAGEVLTDGTLRFRVFKNGESGYCFLAVIRLENGKVASESYSPATTFNGKVKASFTVVDTYTVEGQGDNVNGTYVRGVLSFEASIDDGFTNLDFQVRRDTSTAIATILKERTLIGSLSVKDGLKATGIYIEKGKIINRANQWEVWNLADQRTAWIDDMGNFTIRGVYNNLITVINESNWDKYIIKDQSGRYSHWYLDVLLCGSFIVIESLPADVISEFNAADDGILHLPYYANDNYFSRGYTRYLASSDSEPRLMTDNELRMLAGRKFVIKWNAFPNIANNRALGPIYRPEVYYGGTTTIERLNNRLRDLYAGERHCISINPSDTTVNRSPVLNVPRTFFMSFNLVKFHTNQSDSDYSWGYIWMADDDSGSAAKDDINWT